MLHGMRGPLPEAHRRPLPLAAMDALHGATTTSCSLGCIKASCSMRLRRLRPPDYHLFCTGAQVCAASGSGHPLHSSRRGRRCQNFPVDASRCGNGDPDGIHPRCNSEVMHQNSPVGTQQQLLVRCGVSYLLFLVSRVLSLSTSRSLHCSGVQHLHKHLSTMTSSALSTRCAGLPGCSYAAMSCTGGRSQLHRSAVQTAAAHCTSACVRLTCRSSHQLSAASSKALKVIRTCKATCSTSLRHVYFLAQRNTRAAWSALLASCRMHMLTQMPCTLGPSSAVLRTCSGLQQQHLSRSSRRRSAVCPRASAGDGDSPPKVSVHAMHCVFIQRPVTF